MTNVEGHLTEIALSTLADGQAVDASAHEHLEDCDACQHKLADAILEHAIVGDAMVAAPSLVPEAAKTPWAWIAAAAVVLLGVRGAPLVEALGRESYVRDLQQLAHGVTLVARSLLAESSLALGLVVVVGATALVVMLALWVAPRSEQA